MNEKTLKSKFYKLMMGPAYIIDGILITITFGKYIPQVSLKCAVKLVKSRK